MPSMNAKQIAARPTQWYWIAAIWCGLGLFHATQNVVLMRAEEMQHEWVKLFLTLLLSWLPWALATPLVMQTARRYPLPPARSLTAWLRHAALLILIGLVASAWMAGLTEVLNPWTPAKPPGPFVDLWLAKFYGQLLSSLILYCCILMATYMLDSGERLARQEAQAARLAEQLTKAELAALRHQVEPHFVFNALNGVAGLVRTGQNERAVEMIARLSDFMRHLVQDSGRQEVPLAEELKFAQMYLDIQSARFADRLQVKIDVATDTGRAIVPSLILQPIVENAVKHGIAARVQGGAIEIRVARADGTLTLSVYNDGPRLPANWEAQGEASGAAIGLSNVRSRLRGLYGNGATLKVGNEGQRGVSVSISMPFREQ
jgi:two-component system LytT family sensor kinase